MMHQGDIFKKIGQILNELQDQYEFLAQNPEQLNELELELFLANANFLSDHVEIVRKLNTSVKELPQHTEIIKETEQIPPAPPVSEDTTEVITLEQPELPSTFEFLINDNKQSDKFESPEVKSEAVYNTVFNEEEVIAEQKPQFSEEEVKHNNYAQKEEAEAQQVVAVTQREFPADKIEEQAVILVKAEVSTTKPTLNDILAGKVSQSVKTTNIENAKPAITDLKKAITLNEKLLYIKDLFNGYNLAYSEAIDLINKMPDFKTADAFLRNNYAEKNNWPAKQSTVDQFYELLNQRFAAD